MKEIIALTIPSIFLYIYMILSSIEFGASFFQCFPKILSDKKLIKSYISPVWETTNIFLVFFIVSIFSFFPRASYHFGTDLLPVIFTALVFFGIRVIGMLLIFYGNTNSKPINYLFLIGSFLAPVTLSLVFVYMLTGLSLTMIWTPLFLGLAGMVVSTIILISSTFFRYFGEERDNHGLTILVRCGFYLLLVSLFSFYIALSYVAPYMIQSQFSSAVFLGLIITAVLFFMLAGKAAMNFFSFIGACLLVAAIFFPLLLLHMPYLIYPNVTVYNSFTDPASYKIMIVALAIGMAIVLPSLGLLYYLFVVDKKKIYK